MSDENKRLRIALLTAHTLQNRKQSSWGGTVEYMAQALQRHCGDVYHIGPVHSMKKLLGKAIHKTVRFLLRKNFAYNHSFFGNGYSHSVTRRCDLCFIAQLLSSILKPFEKISL